MNPLEEGQGDSEVSRYPEAECAEILDGLMAAQKRISPKYFYDQRGSELFDEICDLPEYYPTRTEFRIMEDNLPEIAALAEPQVAVIEFGAGSSAKARQLLDGLNDPVAYVPVEISGEYVQQQAREMARDYPDVSIQPVVADFTKPFDLPEHDITPQSNLVFFPGSTIGNFTRSEARRLLNVMKLEAKQGGSLLIGVDLIKDVDVVTAAYNDQRGVTAEFNLNVLRHLNARFGADFQIHLFRHDAVYDTEYDRIEMRLVSQARHSVEIAGQTIRLSKGEHIITEYSHKYGLSEFEQLARDVGLTHRKAWADDDKLFSVHFLAVP